ncbi:MAG: hypothetical protein CMJ31_08550 [Phycisphaerae bacterium]|nr:hypothetical protein [Phycisphaerae bacterium]
MFNLALQLAAATPDDPRVTRGVMLLVLFATAGFGVVFALAMWVAIRHARRVRQRLTESRKNGQGGGRVDAWGEAGKRIDPGEGDHWLRDGDDTSGG